MIGRPRVGPSRWAGPDAEHRWGIGGTRRWCFGYGNVSLSGATRGRGGTGRRGGGGPPGRPRRRRARPAGSARGGGPDRTAAGTPGPPDTGQAQAGVRHAITLRAAVVAPGVDRRGGRRLRPRAGRRLRPRIPPRVRRRGSLVGEWCRHRVSRRDSVWPTRARRADRGAWTMRAAVYDRTGPPEVLRYEEVPDPEVPDDGVLVAVEAISVEGGDTLNRAGGELATVPQSSATSARGRCGRWAARCRRSDPATVWSPSACTGRTPSCGWCPRRSAGWSRRDWPPRSRHVSRWPSAPPTTASSSSADWPKGRRCWCRRGRAVWAWRRSRWRRARAPGCWPPCRVTRSWSVWTSSDWTRGSITRRPTWSPRSGGSPGAGASTWSSSRWVAGPWRRPSPASPTAAAVSRSATPVAVGPAWSTSPTSAPTT